MAPQIILHVSKPHTSILCSFPNLVYPTHHSAHLSYPLILNYSWIQSFSLKKVERFLAILNSDFVTGPDGISAYILKTCSAALAHPLSALFTWSFSLCSFHLPGHLPTSLQHTNMVKIGFSQLQAFLFTSKLWNLSLQSTSNYYFSPTAWFQISVQFQSDLQPCAAYKGEGGGN